MTKGRLNIDDLSMEQRKALAKVQRDLQAAMPKMVEMGRVAQRTFQDLTTAQNWHISETPRPEHVSEPKPWTVGHAQVNYVDKIELRTEGTEQE
jgi:hypothetical protein